MSEIEEVQEQMKADMEAMKEQMATMMEAMMSMKKCWRSTRLQSLLRVPPLRWTYLTHVASIK